MRAFGLILMPVWLWGQPGSSGGVAACTPCHPAIAKSYLRTGMGRAFYKVTPEVMTEDFRTNNTYNHELSERRYTMAERGGRYFQRRHQAGPGGAEINVVEKEIHYVMGSGNHSRAYLSLTPGGQLVQLPLGWYAEGGGKWRMSPGYDRPDHMDFRRKIDKECFFCHDAYPQAGSVVETTNRDLVFRGKPPLGIDCQRCHGTGERHIAAATKAQPVETVRAAILNPARLSPPQQSEVCFQCHLESTSHPLPYSVRKYGREAFTYTPGEPLSQFILHFDQAPGTGHDDKFEISHSAYRMMRSACYRGSKGTLTCITCHNPHEPSAGVEAQARYTKACRSCHARVTGEAHRAAAECVNCHMPKRRTEDAIHVVMTDHTIQRRVPPRDLLAPLKEAHDSVTGPYRGEVAPLYPSTLTGTDLLYSAVAQVTDGANLDRGIADLERLVREMKPKEGEFYLELGKAWQRKGRHDRAVEWFQEASKRGPRLTEARLQHSHSLVQLGRAREAVATLREALSVAPNDPALLNAAGIASTQIGEIAKGIEILAKAAIADPDLPETYLNLGSAYYQANRHDDAIAALRNAIRLAPNLAPAHANLGTLLSMRGDTAGARFHLEEAVKRDAQNAEAAVTLGLLLFRAGDLDRAMALYWQALYVKPKLAAAHFNLGLALARKGRGGEAKTHFEAVLAESPEDHEAHYHLGSALMSAGDLEGASAHFRKAAGSPNAGLKKAAEAAYQKAKQRRN
ncbi:MAG: tetratricopeptide repeat protein [Bryobacterales bacterium]|nr:tetratricopeptide repeat protein [Bryobacterales bacterium]